MRKRGGKGVQIPDCVVAATCDEGAGRKNLGWQEISILCDDDGDKEDDKVSDDDNASDEDDEDLPHRLLAIAKGGRVDLEAPDARGVEQERVRLAHL